MAVIKPLVIVDELAHAELHEHLETIPSRYRAERIRTLAMMALRGEAAGKEKSRKGQVKPESSRSQKSGRAAAESNSEPAGGRPEVSERDAPEPSQEEPDPYSETRRNLISGVGDSW